MSTHPRPSRTFWAAVFTLGFAFSGFWDGILLHQVLQWHHLLSLRPGDLPLETQILADGLFHVAVYLVAVGGLIMLWRGRGGAAGTSAARVAAIALAGFAVWNVIDVVGFHWLAGIHRIRVDVPEADRLAWDLMWLAAFAVVPGAFALWFGRPGTGRGGGGGRPAVAALATLAALAGAAGLRPPPGDPPVAVVFAPGLEGAEMLAAVHGAGGLVLAWPSSRVMMVRLPQGRSDWRLYARGALLVGGAASPAGCLNWSRV